MSAPCTPYIEITHDFNKSDTIYENVPVKEVEEYLKKHIRCYERTGALNRVYIDIDGKADANMTETDFEIKDSSIEFILSNLELDTPYSLMKSSKYNTKKNGKVLHIFSYRITLLNKCGSKHAVREYVEKTLNPIIKSALKEEINYIISKKEKTKEKCDESSTYLDYDEGVYSIGDPVKGTCGRKMRMWNSTKDDDYRPNVLVGESSVVDTLITYIPEGCERIPEPVVGSDMYSISSIGPLSSVQTILTDLDNEDIPLILDSLKKTRVDNYMDWINVGIALKNSGCSCNIWDEWSKLSLKYKPGECYKRWMTFDEREKRITKSSLYYWLKEDNYKVFIEIQQNKKCIRDKLLMCTNGSISDVFYELNPNKYLFSENKGWYFLQSNNTWFGTGSKDILSIPGILNTIRKDCGDIIHDILDKCKLTDTDSQMIKILLDAYRKLSTAGFLKGVAAFLQGLYYREHIEKKMNSNRDIFVFNNTILDTTTYEFRDIQPDDYVSVTCGYDYREPQEDEKLVVKGFLEKIFPKPEILEYVLKVLTTTFVGYNRAEFFHVFTGLGANGKSCLVDLCKIVFGNYYRTLSSSYLTKDDDGKKDRPLPELADADYIRMLVMAEPEEKDKLQVGMIKLFSGSDPIKGRSLYSNFVNEYVPQFKLWIMANDIPKLSKYDQGIERRMRCIHFPTRFVTNPKYENEEQRDETLKEKIMKDETWKYGMLGLLLDVAKIIKVDIINMPLEVKEFTDEYLLQNNPVGSWLKKYYERTDSRNDIIKKGDLYNAFITDTQINKSQKVFSEDIIKCLINEKKVDGIRYYYGLVRKAIIIEDE